MAVADKNPPEAAIQDIEIALNLGECSGDIYLPAAQIFVHAASSDDAWTGRALDCLQKALEHGVSLKEIESDVALSRLFHASTLGRSFPEHVNEVQLPPDPSRYFSPLE